MSETAGSAKKRYTGPTDFLATGDEDEPVRHSSVDLTQYLKTIERSQVNKDAGRAPAVGITVPSESATFHESNFRRAADEMKVGLKFKVVTAAEQTPKQREAWHLADDHVRLLVEVKPRKVFTEEQLASRRAKLKATREANKKKAAEEAAKKAAAEEASKSRHPSQQDRPEAPPDVAKRKGGILNR